VIESDAPADEVEFLPPQHVRVPVRLIVPRDFHRLVGTQLQTQTEVTELRAEAEGERVARTGAELQLAVFEFGERFTPRLEKELRPELRPLGLCQEWLRERHDRLDL